MLYRHKNMALAIWLLFATVAGNTCAMAQTKRPNILFVLTDDQPYDMMGCMGRYLFLQTPMQDRLAREGVSFGNYFCVQSLSSPSRATLLTGMYPHRHGVTLHHKDMEPDWDKTPSYQQLLHDAGYQTAFFGKIHMARKEGKEHIRPGYDYWYSFNEQGEYFDPRLNINGHETQVKGYITNLLTDAAINWMRAERDKSKPFSICLWHKAVHSPWSVAQGNEKCYEEAQVPHPPYNTHLDDLSCKPEYQRARLAHRIDNVPNVMHVNRTAEISRSTKRLSRALLSVDESLEQVFDYLEESGELDNTIIIYSSDNGFLLGENNLGDKRLAYEHSIRIPLIIYCPVLFPAHRVEEMCLNIDVAPTILQIAGVKMPDNVQGVSLQPLLKGEKVSWRNKFLYECYTDHVLPLFNPNLVAIRTEKYKLVLNDLSYDIDELYDLQEDPGEMNNLIDNPRYHKVKKELMQQLDELKCETGYTPDRSWRLRQLGVKDSLLNSYPVKGSGVNYNKKNKN